MVHLAWEAIYCLPGHFFYKFCNIVKTGFRARKPDNLSIKPDLAEAGKGHWNWTNVMYTVICSPDSIH